MARWLFTHYTGYLTHSSLAMLVSCCDEMNPSRRNTMEDVHVCLRPGTWGAPDPSASFIGVFDGHGGRLIVDYLEDHLARNVAEEWCHVVRGGGGEATKADRGGGTPENDGNRSPSKRRRVDSPKNAPGGGAKDDAGAISADGGRDPVLTAFDRAFLLTDIQSRLAGITTSGATVVCCVVAPDFDGRTGRLDSITVHAANAGDARAVLSSRTARALPRFRGGDASEDGGGGGSTRRGRAPPLLPDPEMDGERPAVKGTAVRLTLDHKSTDPAEVRRIEESGGMCVRGRVLGVLAVARSLGDHGLKRWVTSKPHLSSTVVRIRNTGSSVGGGRKGEGLGEGAPKAGGASDPRKPCDVDRRAGSVPPPPGPYTDGEFVIVACDGLWDVMEDQEAVDLVRLAKCEREDVASELVAVAMKRGSTDNITVVVCWL